MAMDCKDTLDYVMADVHEVFRYDRDVRPQDRAHAYLANNRVKRGYDDTAMECAVADMVRRAYALGAGDEGDMANIRRQFAAIKQVAEAALDALEDGE